MMNMKITFLLNLGFNYSIENILNDFNFSYLDGE